MKLGDWYVFCDICGRRCYASETIQLTQYTGRGGMIVCKQDADKIDPGLIPYNIPKEKLVSRVRINHTNTTDGSPLVDLESMSLSYNIIASQDGAYIVSSQDDARIIATEPI